jgi:uncharacterized protein (TIGR03790 family)
MKHCFSIFALLLLSAALHAQAPVNYDDVLLIINSNDTNSVTIGDYFIGKRNIRPRNVLRIDAPAKETITFAEFQSIRPQIEDYLTQSGLRDSINYFVTTKGVPLRITHGAGNDPRNASFDAEIMLILGAYAIHIGENTLFASQTSIRVHNYFQKNEPYKRSNIAPGTTRPYDLYLTTRLTGLTKEDVFALIDRSGPFTFVDKDSARFVFDRDPRPIQLVPYDSNMALAGQMMASRGWNVLLNQDSVFVTHQRNVIGYASWGSNDHYDHHYTQFARPHFHWLPGSLAETYVSTSARNFTPGATSGQSRIADLIAEGCIGASGYVFEPYTVALTWVNFLFDRYTRGYNLAESFYMSNPTFSWMAVIVGDPKTSIVTSMPPAPTPGIVAPVAACVGSSLKLQAVDTQQGLLYWFAGDSSSVLAQGPPFDQTHPLSIAAGAQADFTPRQSGPLSITLLNENFVAKGWAQFDITVLEELAVSIHVSADTLYLDEDPTLLCSADAPDAEHFLWTFGDGASASTEQASHTYTRSGTFTVRCTVSSGECENSDERLIVVLATRPAVRALENPLAFGVVQITKDKRLTAVIENGLSNPVQLNALTLGGAHASDYSTASVSLPVTIPSMGRYNIDVTFTPSALGARVAQLEASIAEYASPLRIELQGEGVQDPTSIAQSAGTILEFDLLQSYPNPASDVARIPFALGKPTHVRLSVLDALGRTQLVLLDDVRPAGFHTETLRTQSLGSGSWMLLLEIDGKRITRPFTVIR